MTPNASSRRPKMGPAKPTRYGVSGSRADCSSRPDGIARAASRRRRNRWVLADDGVVDIVAIERAMYGRRKWVGVRERALDDLLAAGIRTPLTDGERIVVTAQLGGHIRRVCRVLRVSPREAQRLAALARERAPGEPIER